jgi:hypothetical protein
MGAKAATFKMSAEDVSLNRYPAPVNFLCYRNVNVAAREGALAMSGPRHRFGR